MTNTLPERAVPTASPIERKTPRSCPVHTTTALNLMMNNVICECGKSVKGESALAQHKRDSPKHRQSVEPAGSSDHSLSRGQVSNPSSNNGPVPFSSRYPPIQFVRAGESIKHKGKKEKGRFGTKLSRGTGPEVPQLRVNEYGKLYVSGLDNEDWSLCDKDCAWCGHCADGVDFDSL